MQCCYAYLFTIFQHCSHRHDVFSYYEFLLCRALMPVRIFCISSAPNCVADFHSNLDDLTIVRASKRVSIPSSFLWFWIVVSIFVLFFFNVMVTSCRLLHFPPRVVLLTVYFLVGLCALLGDVFKGIGKQGEVKMNDINIHTIANLQKYVWSYGFPKLPICGLGQIYEHGMVALPRKPTPSIKDHRKAKNPHFPIYGDRWVEKLKLSFSMKNSPVSLIWYGLWWRRQRTWWKGLFMRMIYLLSMMIYCWWQWRRQSNGRKIRTASIVGCCPWMDCRTGHLILGTL